MDNTQLAIINGNKKLLKQVINKNFPLSNYIDTSKKTCFCPFHYNVVTESAQVYKDVDGIIRLYCYAENKQYSAYEYIKLILGKNPIELLYNVTIDQDVINEELDFISNKDKEDTNVILNLVEEKLDINTFFKKLYKLQA